MHVWVRSHQLASSGTGQVYARTIAMEQLQKEAKLEKAQRAEFWCSGPCCPGKASSQREKCSFIWDSGKEQFIDLQRWVAMGEGSWLCTHAGPKGCLCQDCLTMHSTMERMWMNFQHLETTGCRENMKQPQTADSAAHLLYSPTWAPGISVGI